MARSKWLPSKHAVLYLVLAVFVSAPFVYGMHNWKFAIAFAFVLVGGAYAGDYGFRKLGAVGTRPPVK
jgi:hypothetical protein